VDERRVLRREGSIWTAFALCALAVCSAWLHAPEVCAQPQDLVQLMLLEGDSVSVRFPTPICASRGLEVGAVIEAEVAESKLISALVAIEEGAPVKFKVTALERNGRKGKPGHMKLVFQSVVAADGAEIFFRDEEIERHGSKKHFVKKVLTLFLIKGGDACVRSDERFHAKFRSTSAVYVPHP
jgi:hypothetical protein